MSLCLAPKFITPVTASWPPISRVEPHLLNVVIRAGKPPGGPLISRVTDLVDAGMIRVVTADLTKTQIDKTRRQRLRGDQRPYQAWSAGLGERKFSGVKPSKPFE
jgi:hypothetical protein